MLKRIKNRIQKLKKKLTKNFACDALLVTSFIIIFFTTFALNVYIAMYLLAFMLLLLCYFLYKF